MGYGFNQRILRGIATRVFRVPRIPSSPAARGLFVSVGACLLTVGLVELAAHGVLAALRGPDSYEAERNPHFRRDWRSFTEPRPRDPNHRLIVLIGSSQGFAQEYEDPSVAFPSRLEEMIAQARPQERWTVANWSVSGGVGQEMVVLGARASMHDPDLVILVTHHSNFCRGSRVPLTKSLSDVAELAYYGPVRSLLSRRFLRHGEAKDPTTWLTAHSGLMRLHNRVFEPRDGAWTWTTGERWKSPPKVTYRTHPWVADASWLLREFVEVTRDRGRLATPVIVVSMPLYRPSFRPGDWAMRADFARRARAALAGEPAVTVLDAVELVDPSLFTSVMHVDPEGHEELAAWLLPYVLEAVQR